MNDLAKFGTWLQAQGAQAIPVLNASVEFLAALQGQAQTSGRPPLQLVTGIPMADRALADAVGLAAIAGQYGVTLETVLEGVGLLKAVVALVAA